MIGQAQPAQPPVQTPHRPHLPQQALREPHRACRLRLWWACVSHLSHAWVSPVCPTPVSEHPSSVREPALATLWPLLTLEQNAPLDGSLSSQSRRLRDSQAHFLCLVSLYAHTYRPALCCRRLDLLQANKFELPLSKNPRGLGPRFVRRDSDIHSDIFARLFVLLNYLIERPFALPSHPTRVIPNKNPIDGDGPAVAICHPSKHENT